MRFFLLVLVTLWCLSYGCTKSKSSNDSADGEMTSETDTVSSGTEEALPPVAAVIALTGSARADGNSSFSVTVTLTDINGQPVSGFTPTISATGYDVTVQQTCAVSDENGISNCPNAISSSVEQTIEVTLSSSSISTTPASKTFLRKKYGYTPRICGFNADDDSDISEVSDCRICDGSTSDPDGDGVDEDFYYVDSYNGNDTTGDGTSAKPYKTIAQAVTNSDGNASSKEDVFCLYGTFNESIVPGYSGVTGDFSFDGMTLPDNPTVFSGWDKDGDGIYPPVDSDDEAVIDGQNAIEWAVRLDTNNVNYIEVAHLTIKNFEFSATSGGAITAESSAGGHYVYVHDVEFDGINEGLSQANQRAFFRSESTDHVSLVNNNIQNLGGYFYNKTLTNDDSSGFNIVNNSFLIKGPMSSSFVNMIRLNFHDGLRFSGNHFDGNVDAWDGQNLFLLRIQSCVRNVLIEENDVDKTSYFLGVNFNELCTTPTVTDNIVVNRNDFEAYRIGAGNSSFINLRSERQDQGSSTDASYRIENVTVTNNVIKSYDGKLDHCLNIGVGQELGGAFTGEILFVGNTCYGFNNGGVQQYPDSNSILQNNVTVNSNIFVPHASSTRNLWFNNALSNVQSNFNIYTDPDLDFNFNSVYTDLSDWSTNTLDDADSLGCTPLFVDSAGGDLHLASGDSCASAVANGVTTWTSEDIDGDSRPATSSNIGADN